MSRKPTSNEWREARDALLAFLLLGTCICLVLGRWWGLIGGSFRVIATCLAIAFFLLMCVVTKIMEAEKQRDREAWRKIAERERQEYQREIDERKKRTKDE